jgi:hypothetical protein
VSEAEIIHDAEVIGTEIVDNLPAVRASTAIVARDEISVAEVVAQHEKIVQVMQAVMKPDVHYGIIPGVRNPSLFKAGAETLLVALRLAPHYVSEKIWHDDGHLTVSVACTLKHIPTGLEVATGEGLCSSRESRYAYRQGGRMCPECGKDTIIKGKAEYGGGWICFAKKGGCGAKWPDDSEQARAFETTEIGRVDNPDLADTFNTVLKMADKRALIAAVLNGTAASDVFTQDVEDSQPSASAEPQPQAERRENAPKPLAAPKSWAKLTEMVAAYDERVHDVFFQFRDSVCRLQFPPAYAFADLKQRSDKDYVWQKCVGAALLLRERFDPNELPFPDVDDICACFADVMDGVELAIPDEALDAEATEAAERDA